MQRLHQYLPTYAPNIENRTLVHPISKGKLSHFTQSFVFIILADSDLDIICSFAYGKGKRGGGGGGKCWESCSPCYFVCGTLCFTTAQGQQTNLSVNVVQNLVNSVGVWRSY